jgi:hypothetical protein
MLWLYAGVDMNSTWTFAELCEVYCDKDPTTGLELPRLDETIGAPSVSHHKRGRKLGHHAWCNATKTPAPVWSCKCSVRQVGRRVLGLEIHNSLTRT